MNSKLQILLLGSAIGTMAGLCIGLALGQQMQYNRSTAKAHTIRVETDRQIEDRETALINVLRLQDKQELLTQVRKQFELEKRVRQGMSGDAK